MCILNSFKNKGKEMNERAGNVLIRSVKRYSERKGEGTSAITYSKSNKINYCKTG